MTLEERALLLLIARLVRDHLDRPVDVMAMTEAIRRVEDREPPGEAEVVGS